MPRFDLMEVEEYLEDDPMYGEDGPPGPSFNDVIRKSQNKNVGIPKEILMTVKKTKPKTIRDYAIKSVDMRPTLIHVGNHLVDPNDVACITKVNSNKDLYVVRLKSQPNMEYPIWVKEAEITPLLQQFHIITEEV